MEYGATAHNRTVYAAPAVAGLASIRLGQSPAAPSHASLRHILPVLVALPAETMLRKALIRAAKTP